MRRVGRLPMLDRDDLLEVIGELAGLVRSLHEELVVGEDQGYPLPDELVEALEDGAAAMRTLRRLPEGALKAKARAVMREERKRARIDIQAVDRWAREGLPLPFDRSVARELELVSEAHRRRAMLDPGLADALDA
jgi:hypothetical protein